MWGSPEAGALSGCTGYTPRSQLWPRDISLTVALNTTRLLKGASASFLRWELGIFSLPTLVVGSESLNPAHTSEEGNATPFPGETHLKKVMDTC